MSETTIDSTMATTRVHARKAGRVARMAQAVYEGYSHLCQQYHQSIRERDAALAEVARLKAELAAREEELRRHRVIMLESMERDVPVVSRETVERCAKAAANAWHTTDDSCDWDHDLDDPSRLVFCEVALSVLAAAGLRVEGEGESRTLTGVERIAAERQRQVDKEGWSESHDDDHDCGELAWAAAVYAAPLGIVRKTGSSYSDPWPWSGRWNKKNKHNRLRQLEIAGALCAAEIDRLLRVEGEPAANSSDTPNSSPELSDEELCEEEYREAWDAYMQGARGLKGGIAGIVSHFRTKEVVPRLTEIERLRARVAELEREVERLNPY